VTGVVKSSRQALYYRVRTADDSLLWFEHGHLHGYIASTPGQYDDETPRNAQDSSEEEQEVENEEDAEHTGPRDDDAEQGAVSRHAKEDAKEEAAEAEAQLKRMKWTHKAKMALYGWVVKINPYDAPHGQHKLKWIAVSQAVKESTKNLPVNERVDVIGHGLQLFVKRQHVHWSKRTKKEISESGQAGQLSDLENKEVAQLETIKALQTAVATSKAVISKEKKILQDCKNGQMNDVIYAAAAKSAPINLQVLKNLSAKKRVIQAKLEAFQGADTAATPDVALAKLSEEERQVLLKYAEVRQRAKANVKAELGPSGSEQQGTEPSDSDDDLLTATGGKKNKRGWERTTDSLDMWGSTISKCMSRSTAYEEAAIRVMEARTAALAAVAARLQVPLTERLQRVDDAVTAKTITQAEGEARRKSLIDEYF